MLTENDFIGLWKELKDSFPDESEDGIASLFGAEILRSWGWPYKPIPVSESMPPINQTFLGYFPETGWLLDFWREGYIPYKEDMPTHWLSVNVLPTPSHDQRKSRV